MNFIFFQLVCSQVKKLVVVLLNVDTNEVLERWEFNIEVEDDDVEATKENAGDNKDKRADKAPKDLAKIKQERCCSKILILSSDIEFEAARSCLWQGKYRCTYVELIYDMTGDWYEWWSIY